MKEIKSIQSKQIRKLAEHLFSNRIPVTYFGKPWGNCTNNWIYFDTYFDIEKMKAEFKLDENFEVHENLDPKSGLERGFIDKSTGEGIMGKVLQKQI